MIMTSFDSENIKLLFSLHYISIISISFIIITRCPRFASVNLVNQRQVHVCAKIGIRSNNQANSIIKHSRKMEKQTG